MTEKLTGRDLRRLVQRVFNPGPEDRALALLVDLPDARCPDNPAWAARREMVREWAGLLAREQDAVGLKEISLAWFRNAGGNNADLPPTFVHDSPGPPPAKASDLESRPQVPFADLFATHSLLLAPTELSATAPLKVAARGAAFRAATMPGFTPEMIPALKIDYVEVNRRVQLLKELCDPAEAADLVFRTAAGTHSLRLDLRHRTAFASGGLFPSNGVAGNLPSGETFIVPYEGEKPDDPSRSAGELPVQIGDEVVLYEISGNRAVAVLSSSPQSEVEKQRIEEEPAYANLAELGLGVLGDFGLQPVGSILLDEKLGLHIAFGRSDHFGGVVGPTDFSSPEAVIHLDRVYLPESQPLVTVAEVKLLGPAGEKVIIREGNYANLFE